MKKIVIFASGSGTNAENIFNYFKDSDRITVDSIFTNNSKAGIIERSKRLGIPCKIFNRDEFVKSDKMLNELLVINPDLIVLAGFLWLVPENIIEAFANKIINIHPALLPKYGGKGMYGDRVHKAVIEAGEKESGITIHWVNKFYDEGKVILQEVVIVDEEDNADSLATKIHELEYEYFPKVIEKLLI